MTVNCALVRAAAITLALIMVGEAGAQTAGSLPITDANRATRNLSTWLFPDATYATRTPLVSPLTGLPYNMNNGQPIAPAVSAGYPTSRSFQIVTAGTVYTAMPAATTTPRKGGYCQASFSNAGVVGLAASGQQPATPPSISNDVELVAGQSFDMNQHGYAIQNALLAVGTVAGDRVLCQDLQ